MKKFLIIFSFAAFMLLAGLVSVPYWLDVNNYKPEIAAFIKNKTGYKVNVSGNITLHILPDISLTVKDVDVLSFNETKQPIVSASELILKVRLIPLIQKNIEVESLILKSPSIYLHKKNNGTANWETMPVALHEATIEEAHEETEAVKEITLKEEIHEHHVPSFYDLMQFEELKIVDGTFYLLDEPSNNEISVTHLNIDTSLSRDDNPFDISGKLNIFEDDSKGHFNINGKFQLNGSSGYSVKDVAISLDKIKGNSNIVLDPYSFKPTVNIAFYFKNLNLNGYKIKKIAAKNNAENSKEAVESSTAEATSKNATWDDTPIDFSIINDYDGHFSFKADSISYDNYNIENCDFTSYLRNNKLSYNLKNFNIYGGNITGEGVINNSGGPINVTGDIKLSDIDLEKLPKNISFIKSAEGKLNSDLNLKSSGFSVKQFISNLNGEGSFKVSEGVLEGIDFFSMVNNVTAAFNIGSISNKTRFENISASFNATKGILSNSDLVLKSDLFNFTGQGDINLNNMTINYTITPKYSQDFNKDTNRPVIPILISGDLAHPIFRLEVKTIVRDLINNPDNASNIVNQLKSDFKNLKNNFSGDSGAKALKELKDIFK